jgi:hypothetical protein
MHTLHDVIENSESGDRPRTSNAYADASAALAESCRTEHRQSRPEVARDPRARRLSRKAFGSVSELARRTWHRVGAPSTMQRRRLGSPLGSNDESLSIIPGAEVIKEIYDVVENSAEDFLSRRLGRQSLNARHAGADRTSGPPKQGYGLYRGMTVPRRCTGLGRDGLERGGGARGRGVLMSTARSMTGHRGGRGCRVARGVHQRRST